MVESSDGISTGFGCFSDRCQQPNRGFTVGDDAGSEGIFGESVYRSGAVRGWFSG
jgi:hypothetical protein